MIEGAFALAFTAGLVASVNPCGFAMLPAYLSYFMGLQDERDEPGRAASVLQGFVVGGVVSAGFIVVFALVGVPIALGTRSVIGAIPWAAIIVGLGLVGLGIAMLAGYQLQVGLPKLERVRRLRAGRVGRDRVLVGDHSHRRPPMDCRSGPRWCRDGGRIGCPRRPGVERRRR